MRRSRATLIVFVGQVARGALGREAFQEIDYGAVFGTMAKWVVQIDDARRLPELVSRAFHVATSGRPGPVVVALPEHMLTDAVQVADALPYTVPETYPGTPALQELAGRLQAAERPVVILGGSRCSDRQRGQQIARGRRRNGPTAGAASSAAGRRAAGMIG